jgi:hypothetical protein
MIGLVAWSVSSFSRCASSGTRGRFCVGRRFIAQAELYIHRRIGAPGFSVYLHRDGWRFIARGLTFNLVCVYFGVVGVFVF